jgi:putative copper resistance protein D
LLETAVILLRLVQYGAASILFGSSLFLLYALPRSGALCAGSLSWPRPLVVAAAIVLLFATVLGLLAQTAIMAGSVAAALMPESLKAVVTEMELGRASVVRAAAAGGAALVLLLPIASMPRWSMVAGLGAMATGSFAWMGHGAATEGIGGLVHLLSDIVHSWAAAAWIGALCAFVFLLARPERSAEALRVTHRALRRFSGVGTGLVGVLLGTGLLNSWFLVGPENVERLLTTGYGLLLSLKLALFAGMLALASVNRFRLTPWLEGTLGRPASGSTAIRALRRSVMLETMLGLAVLGAVAWYGTLPPPTSA